MNYTQNYNLYVPVRGEYPGNWDVPLNINLNSIDSIIKSIEINNRGLEAPVGKEVGTLWYDTGLEKLRIKKPTGYYNLIDSENIIAIIGNTWIYDNTQPAPVTGIVLNTYPDTPIGQSPFYVIEAQWDPADDEVNFPSSYHDDFLAYIITLRREGDSFVEQKISYVNSYKFYNIKPGFRYEVTLQIVDKQGNKSLASITSSIDVYDTALIPVSPTGISATGTFKGIIILWNTPIANDIASYEVHASEVNAFTPDETTLKYSGSSTIVTITKDIKVSTTYYIKVRTKNRSGNWSPYSPIASATTKSIQTADYQALSIVNAAIADLAVDNAKISSLDAVKINTGFLDADRIEAGSIVADKLAAKSITSDKLVAGGNLVDIAANKTILVSDGNVINKGMCSYTSTDSGIWEVFSTQFPATAQIDLTGGGNITGIGEISFSSYSNSVNLIPGKYTIEYATSLGTWLPLIDEADNFIPSAISEISYYVGAVDARYIRLTILADACQAGQDRVKIANFKVKARQGATLITGDVIQTGSLSASHISTTTLSAITSDLGEINAGTIDLVSSSSWIKSGQSNYNAGQGFWLGIHNNIPKFSLGDAQGAGIKWDGTNLKITGSVIIGAAPDGTGGVTADEISNEAYRVEVESTNGNTFKPGESLVTTLIAHVYRGDTEVTSEIDANRFRWRRFSYYPLPYPNDDTTWNNDYRQGYKQIIITTDTVESRATFHCDIMTD